MKIETQTQDNCTLTLTIEVDDERVQPALRRAARDLSKHSRIPGFRPGKAPYDVIVRQFGEGALYEAALEDLSQKVYAEALDQAEVEAYGPGSLDDVQLKPLVLKFTVPLRPEVDLGDYRALRAPYDPPAVSDEAVNDALEHLREHRAVLEPVERPAEMGDVAVLDVKGYLNEGENPSDFLMADQNIALLLEEATDWPVPGFAPHIVGLQAGGEKKFDLSFPEDYANESLRGQLAHFEVKAQEIKRRELPEWSDELAKEIGDYESLDAMRASVRSDLERQAALEVDEAYERQVVEQLTDQTAVKYPPMLLESELDDMLEELDQRLREQRLTLNDYLKIEGKTKDALREEYRPRAETRLKRGLALSQVVELEKLTVSDEDVEDKIARLSTPWGEHQGEMRKLLSSERARRSLAMDILTEKAVKLLAAVARGEDVPLPAAAEAESEAGASGEEAEAAAPAETDISPEPAAEAPKTEAVQEEAGSAPAAETPAQ